MSAMNKYLDIIYDANNGVKQQSYECNDYVEKKRLLKMLENCEHIKNIRTDNYKLIITYDCKRTTRKPDTRF